MLIFILLKKPLNLGESEENIIEKIDIGGISLIRAAAKNFKDVMCVSSKDDYSDFLHLLDNNGEINLESRKNFAIRAFQRLFSL